MIAALGVHIPAEFCQQKLREAWASALDGLLLALREGFLGVMTEPAGAAGHPQSQPDE
jgi:hypothetical protein